MSKPIIFLKSILDSNGIKANQFYPIHPTSRISEISYNIVGLDDQVIAGVGRYVFELCGGKSLSPVRYVIVKSGDLSEPISCSDVVCWDDLASDLQEIDKMNILTQNKVT